MKRADNNSVKVWWLYENLVPDYHWSSGWAHHDPAHCRQWNNPIPSSLPKPVVRSVENAKPPSAKKSDNDSNPMTELPPYSAQTEGAATIG